MVMMGSVEVGLRVQQDKGLARAAGQRARACSKRNTAGQRARTGIRRSDNDQSGHFGQGDAHETSCTLQQKMVDASIHAVTKSLVLF